MYWDANNLYACGTVQPLPYRNIRFNREITWDAMRSLPPDAPKGYALRVNFEYPDHLHDVFKEFPPCPENMIPNHEQFSQHQTELSKKLGVISKTGKYNGNNKLVPHLMEHKDYVIQHRNWQFIESLGVKITEVKEIVEFDQKDWMAPYIEFNTEQRKHATNDFEKNLFKLMNNSVFGKTMEQVKNRMKLHITLMNIMLRSGSAKSI